MTSSNIEKTLWQRFESEKAESFQHWVDSYDREVSASLVKQGWKYVKRSERSACFSFGEMTFMRRCYCKDGNWCFPVDECLGLPRYARHSQYLLFKLSFLATLMPYRRVAQTLEFLQGIGVTKDTVLKAVKTTSKYLNEQENYYACEEKKEEKVEADYLYIEGDGVYFHTQNTKRACKEMIHFVVHTGRKKIGKKRYKLENKHEIVAFSHRQARQRLIKCLDTNYLFHEKTILITNSDMGAGYGAKTFKDLARFLHLKNHYHFWDRYHVNELIRRNFRNQSKALRDLCFEAIKTHQRNKLIACLDTLESNLFSSVSLETFFEFKERILKYFKYTRPLTLCDLPSGGVGIIESQHRKLTYRMKNKGMYWSHQGAEAMCQMILYGSKGLYELFFGDWLETWQELKPCTDNWGNYLRKSHPSYLPRQGKVVILQGKIFR